MCPFHDFRAVGFHRKSPCYIGATSRETCLSCPEELYVSQMKSSHLPGPFSWGGGVCALFTTFKRSGFIVKNRVYPIMRASHDRLLCSCWLTALFRIPARGISPHREQSHDHPHPAFRGTSKSALRPRQYRSETLSCTKKQPDVLSSSPSPGPDRMPPYLPRIGCRPLQPCRGFPQ